MPSPLIKTMIEQYNYPVLNVDNFDDFIKSKNECVLFFTENPTRFPESDDVAMILPELIKEYGNRFSAAVIEQDSQRKLQARFDFKTWPTLVFLRKGEYLGSISRVQDWNEYIIQINTFLTEGPKKVLSVGIPIETTSSSNCSN